MMLESPDRTSGLGGTDVSAILGLHPWRTALDVYLEKTDPELMPDPGNMEIMELGLELEPVIASRYHKRTGRALAKAPTVRHPSIEWARVSPDYMIRAEEVPEGQIAVAEQVEYPEDLVLGSLGILECKAHGYKDSEDYGEEGGDHVPKHERIQTAWQAGIISDVREEVGATAIAEVDLGVLFAGRRFERFVIPFDPDLYSHLLEGGARFWRDHVEARKPPEPDHRDGKTLTAIYPRHLEDEPREATAEEIALARKLQTLLEAHETAAERLEAVRNRLKDRIGEAPGIVFPGGKITWKRSKDTTGTDWRKVAETLHRETIRVLSGVIPDANLEAMRRQYKILVEDNTGIARKGSRRFLSRFK